MKPNYRFINALAILIGVIFILVIYPPLRIYEAISDWFWKRHHVKPA